MTDIRELAQQVIAKGELATAGEWEAGDRYSVCGVFALLGRCSSCGRGELIWEGRRDINGTAMKAHIHLQEPFDKNQIVVRDGGDVWTVVNTTDEYGAMDPADADFIAFTRSAAPTLARELIKALDENERLRRDVEVWMRQFNKARDEVVGLRRIAGEAIESGDHGGGIAETTVARLRSELATVADLNLELHKESE